VIEGDGMLDVLIIVGVIERGWEIHEGDRAQPATVSEGLEGVRQG
jgi:hypothetical protein